MMQTIEVPDYLADAFKMCAETLALKGADYSASDDQWTSNFTTTAEHLGIWPWESADFNEVQKLARLSALRKRGRGPLNEGVEDTYRDKACYSLLALGLLLHHNRTAHPAELSGTLTGRNAEIALDREAKRP